MVRGTFRRMGRGGLVVLALCILLPSLSLATVQEDWDWHKVVKAGKNKKNATFIGV